MTTSTPISPHAALTMDEPMEAVLAADVDLGELGVGSFRLDIQVSLIYIFTP